MVTKDNLRPGVWEKFKDGTVIPAIPLYLNDRREFDPAGQRRLIRYYEAAGAGGIACGVHTTQFAIRKPEIGLFEPVLSEVLEEIKLCEEKRGEPIIRIAGGFGPTEQVIREAELVREMGYDMMLLSPGGLPADADEDAHVARIRAVAEIIPTIAFYMQTAVGGRVFTYDYWRKVFALPGVIGVKMAPFNRYMTFDVMRAVANSGRSEDVALYTGNDDNIVADLLTPYVFETERGTVRLTIAGGLLGHWTYWVKPVVELHNRIKDLKKSGSTDIPADLLTLGTQITDANGVVFDYQHNFAGVITGVHEVLRRQGLFANILTLDPEEVLSPGQAEEITRVCEEYPHLTDDEFVAEFLRKERESPRHRELSSV